MPAARRELPPRTITYRAHELSCFMLPVPTRSIWIALPDVSGCVVRPASPIRRLQSAGRPEKNAILVLLEVPTEDRSSAPAIARHVQTKEGIEKWKARSND